MEVRITMLDYYTRRTRKSFRILAISEIACTALVEVATQLSYKDDIKEIELSDGKFVALQIDFTHESQLNDMIVREFMEEFKRTLKKIRRG